MARKIHLPTGRDFVPVAVLVLGVGSLVLHQVGMSGDRVLHWARNGLLVINDAAWLALAVAGYLLWRRRRERWSMYLVWTLVAGRGVGVLLGWVRDGVWNTLIDEGAMVPGRLPQWWPLWDLTTGTLQVVAVLVWWWGFILMVVNLADHHGSLLRPVRITLLACGAVASVRQLLLVLGIADAVPVVSPAAVHITLFWFHNGLPVLLWVLLSAIAWQTSRGFRGRWPGVQHVTLRWLAGAASAITAGVLLGGVAGEIPLIKGPLLWLLHAASGTLTVVAMAIVVWKEWSPSHPS